MLPEKRADTNDSTYETVITKVAQLAYKIKPHTKAPSIKNQRRAQSRPKVKELFISKGLINRYTL